MHNYPGKRLFPIAFCLPCRAYFLCCVAAGDRDMRRLTTMTDGLDLLWTWLRVSGFSGEEVKEVWKGLGITVWLSPYIVGHCAKGLCSLPSSFFHSDVDESVIR